MTFYILSYQLSFLVLLNFRRHGHRNDNNMSFSKEILKLMAMAAMMMVGDGGGYDCRVFLLLYLLEVIKKINFFRSF